MYSFVKMDRKDFTPALMSFLLLLGIVALAIVRQWRIPNLWVEYPVNLDTVFAGLYALWIFAETPVAKRDLSTEGKRTSDSATCQVYAFGQAFTFLSALWSPSVWREPNAAHFLGFSIFLLGVCYRLWAIWTLGQFYSHRVRTLPEHRIVSSGPYRLTRHPAYAGMILLNAGVVLYFLNWVTLCIFVFALVPAIVLRIGIEERVLFGIEGYPEFAKRRKRLFPLVW
jgi:protein-S-isoprenylcysteine O-methyltransferase Ste14